LRREIGVILSHTDLAHYPCGSHSRAVIDFVSVKQKCPIRARAGVLVLLAASLTFGQQAQPQVPWQNGTVVGVEQRPFDSPPDYRCTIFLDTADCKPKPSSSPVYWYLALDVGDRRYILRPFVRGSDGYKGKTGTTLLILTDIFRGIGG
jgi:hypothetical protein